MATELKPATFADWPNSATTDYSARPYVVRRSAFTSGYCRDATTETVYAATHAEASDLVSEAMRDPLTICVWVDRAEFIGCRWLLRPLSTRRRAVDRDVVRVWITRADGSAVEM